jgi:tetratricopeptide (TPR) repeat protein
MFNIQKLKKLILVIGLIINVVTITAEDKKNLNEANLLLTKGKVVEAINILNNLIRQDPLNITVINTLASVYLSQNRADEAVKLLIPYVKQNPQNRLLVTKLGDAFFNQQEYDNAAVTYKQSIEIDNNYSEELIGKLATTYLLKGRLIDAEKILKNGIKLTPNSIILNQSLGALLIANGNPKDGIKYVLKSIEIQPIKESYAILGLGYAKTGEFREALSAYTKAKKLGENSPQIEAEIERLKILVN